MSDYISKPLFSTAGIDATSLENAGLGYASQGLGTDLATTSTVDTPKVDTSAVAGVGSFLGSNLQGIGTLASVIGGIMANNASNKFKEKVYKNESARAAREEKRAAKFRSDFGKGWS